MNGEMHDTCEVMSGRVQYLESEMKLNEDPRIRNERNEEAPS